MCAWGWWMANDNLLITKMYNVDIYVIDKNEMWLTWATIGSEPIRQRSTWITTAANNVWFAFALSAKFTAGWAVRSNWMTVASWQQTHIRQQYIMVWTCVYNSIVWIYEHFLRILTNCTIVNKGRYTSNKPLANCRKCVFSYLRSQLNATVLLKLS